MNFKLPILGLMTTLVVGFLAACGGDFPISTPPNGPTTTASNTPGPTPHEGDEGLVLGQETSESVYQGGRCQADAPVRALDLVAINIEISLNRFLDFDPIGRMYVLEQDLTGQEQRKRETGTPGQTWQSQRTAHTSRRLRIRRSPGGLP